MTYHRSDRVLVFDEPLGHLHHFLPLPPRRGRSDDSESESSSLLAAFIEVFMGDGEKAELAEAHRESGRCSRPYPWLRRWLCRRRPGIPLLGCRSPGAGDVMEPSGTVGALARPGTVSSQDGVLALVGSVGGSAATGRSGTRNEC